MAETPPAALERQKQPPAQPPGKMVYSFGIVQNIAVFLLSLVVAGVILTVLWVPWAMRHAN